MEKREDESLKAARDELLLNMADLLVNTAVKTVVHHHSHPLYPVVLAVMEHRDQLVSLREKRSAEHPPNGWPHKDKLGFPNYSAQDGWHVLEKKKGDPIAAFWDAHKRAWCVYNKMSHMMRLHDPEGFYAEGWHYKGKI